MMLLISSFQRKLESTFNIRKWILAFAYLGVFLIPVSGFADASDIEKRGYDLQALYEFATPYMPDHYDDVITLQPPQLAPDVRTKSSFMKKFSVRDDLAKSGEFKYADGCDTMIAYFSEDQLIKMTFEVSGGCD